MTPEQQRIKIAAACGWIDFREEVKPTITYLWHEGGKRDIVPDYLDDLNAIREAVMMLRNQQRAAHDMRHPHYGRYARYVGILEGMFRGHYGGAIDAPAPARAEAFLRATGE